MSSKVSRRGFLQAMGLAAASLGTKACQPFWSGGGRPSNGPDHGTPLPVRALGDTGERVSLLGLGGEAALDKSDQGAAEEIINYAIDSGVNYIDTSPRYGNTRSETNIGRVMKYRRKEVFLATKSKERTYSKVLQDFDDSLNRLQTDYIDLYQVHNIGESSDVSELFAEDGNGNTAIDAFEQLRREGREGRPGAHYIGITGHHDPQQLLAVLNHDDAPAFDAVLMALNPADRHRRPFQQELLTVAQQRKMAIIAMKVTGMTYLFDDIPNMSDCLNYVYSLPISCAIVAISELSELEQNLQITRDFSTPLSTAEREALENMTTPTPGDTKWNEPEKWRGDFFKVIRY